MGLKEKWVKLYDGETFSFISSLKDRAYFVMPKYRKQVSITIMSALFPHRS